MIFVFVVVVCLVFLAALFATATGRDFLARRVGEVLEVERMIHAPGRLPRDLYAFRVRDPRSADPGVVILAASQTAAAEALLEEDGQALAIDCLLSPYRVLDSGGAPRLAVLPQWAARLGRSICEHGGRHPDPLPTGILASELEALLAEGQAVPEDAIVELLLRSEVLVVNMEVLDGPDGPRIRLPAIPVAGQMRLPVFTSEAYVPPEPGLQLSRHPFRFLLEVLSAQPISVVIDPHSPLERILEVETIERLVAMQ